MPQVQWALQNGRPCVQVVLTLAPSSEPLERTLIADTGAGSLHAGFEMILEEDDCLLCGGVPGQPMVLGGAYSGSFPVDELRVGIPALQFDQKLRVVGVPSLPTGFDGIAGFRFLNRFAYGNFGDAGQFDLER